MSCNCKVCRAKKDVEKLITDHDKEVWVDNGGTEPIFCTACMEPQPASGHECSMERRHLKRRITKRKFVATKTNPHPQPSKTIRHAMSTMVMFEECWLRHGGSYFGQPTRYADRRQNRE